MKTRTIQEIRRDLSDAERRLREIKKSSVSAMRYFDSSLTDSAESAMQLLQNLIDYYELELAGATRFGEQLTLDF